MLILRSCIFFIFLYFLSTTLCEELEHADFGLVSSIQYSQQYNKLSELGGSFDDWIQEIGYNGFSTKLDIAHAIQKNSSLLATHLDYFGANEKYVNDFVDLFTEGISFVSTEMPHQIPKKRYLITLNKENSVVYGLLIKIFHLTEEFDTKRASSEARLEKIMDQLEEIQNVFTFSKPIDKYRAQIDDKSVQINVYEFLLGGTLDYSFEYYWEGKIKKKILDEHIILVANALATLHTLTSSYQLSKTDLFITPGVPGLGIQYQFGPPRILHSLEIIEDLANIKINVQAFLDNIIALETEQTVFSLIHGNPLVTNVMITSKNVRFLSYHDMRLYLFNLIKDGPQQGSILIHPKVVISGSPEFDYFIFREHLRILMKYLNYPEDEVIEFVEQFDTNYCIIYHTLLQKPIPKPLTPCTFESPEFSKYVSLLAKFSLAEQFPQYFGEWFNEYIITPE